MKQVYYATPASWRLGIKEDRNGCPREPWNLSWLIPSYDHGILMNMASEHIVGYRQSQSWIFIAHGLLHIHLVTWIISGILVCLIAWLTVASNDRPVLARLDWSDVRESF